MFFCSRLRWADDLAFGAGGSAELRVKGDEWTTQRLGHRNVPSVIAGQVAPQFPYAIGKRRKGKQRQIELKQIPICAGGLESRDLTGSFQPPENVARLGRRQLRTGQKSIADYGFRPDSHSSRVDQYRDNRGRIDDCRHVRSASRARRMLEGRTRVCVASLRPRTCCSHVSRDGLDAIRSSSRRRNSCMD